MAFEKEPPVPAENKAEEIKDAGPQRESQEGGFERLAVVAEELQQLSTKKDDDLVIDDLKRAVKTMYDNIDPWFWSQEDSQENLGKTLALANKIIPLPDNFNALATDNKDFNGWRLLKLGCNGEHQNLEYCSNTARIYLFEVLKQRDKVDQILDEVATPAQLGDFIESLCILSQSDNKDVLATAANITLSQRERIDDIARNLRKKSIDAKDYSGLEAGEDKMKTYKLVELWYWFRGPEYREVISGMTRGEGRKDIERRIEVRKTGQAMDWLKESSQATWTQPEAQSEEDSEEHWRDLKDFMDWQEQHDETIKNNFQEVKTEISDGKLLKYNAFEQNDFWQLLPHINNFFDFADNKQSDPEFQAEVDTLARRLSTAVRIALGEVSPKQLKTFPPERIKDIHELLAQYLVRARSIKDTVAAKDFLDRQRQELNLFPEWDNFMETDRFSDTVVNAIQSDMDRIKNRAKKNEDGERIYPWGVGSRPCDHTGGDKLLRPIIGKFGIDAEKCLAAWRTTHEPDIKKEIEQLKTLEAAQAGSVKFLFETFGIVHFSRYPTEVLLKQIKNYDDTANPYLVAINPYNDWNGAFKQHLETWQKVAKQLDRLKFNLRIVEGGGKIDLANELLHLKSRYGQASGGFVGGHGSADSISFGGKDPAAEPLSYESLVDEKIKDDAVLASEDLSDQDIMAAIKDFFKPGSTVALISCSTGAEGGIGQKLSETKLKFVGPEIPANIQDINILPQGDDLVDIKIKYHKAEAKSYVGGKSQK